MKPARVFRHPVDVKKFPGQHALEKHLPEEAHRPWCGREMVLRWQPSLAFRCGFT